MATVDDAIFLMDDEVICDTVKKPLKTASKKIESNMSKSLPSETIQIINIAKSPPINIIKPNMVKMKKTDEFVPSSPYSTI